jgi:hypothetical protein
MPEVSFGVSVVPRTGPFRMTGPMKVAGLALLACALVRLSGLDHAGFSFCYFKLMTGYACFTCGSTRALGYLSRFDPASALAIQPFVTIGTLSLIAWGALDAVLSALGRVTEVKMDDRTPRRLLICGVVLATLNWAYLLAMGV